MSTVFLSGCTKSNVEDSAHSEPTVIIDREYGDKMFLNFYQFMTEAQYRDSLYSSDYGTFEKFYDAGEESTVYNFNFDDKKGKREATVWAVIKPRIVNDSLIGITLSMQRSKFSANPCEQKMMQSHLVPKMIALYQSKYGVPEATRVDGIYSLSHWSLPNGDIYIGREKLSGCPSARGEFISFDIDYFAKGYGQGYKDIFDPNSYINRPDTAARNKAKDAI